MAQIALHLDDLVAERQVLADFLAQPTAYSDPEFTIKNKRFSELETLIAKAEERQQLTKNLEEARKLAIGGDEIAELAMATKLSSSANPPMTQVVTKKSFSWSKATRHMPN